MLQLPIGGLHNISQRTQQFGNNGDRNNVKNLKNIIKLVPLLACAYASSAQALVINFNHAATMDTRALAGFQAAADLWSARLHDKVAVNLNIGFSALATGVLGSTGSTRATVSYAGYRDALAGDAWGKTDRKAVAGLSTSNCLSVYMNGTGVNPNGVGSGTPFLDNNCNANNSTIRLTTANARAVGLVDAFAPIIDGSVSFSSAFTWDFNPEDGITAGSFDFIGVAAHEIGHALGFVSGIDTVDANIGRNVLDSAFTYIAPADLFRCSDESKAAGADLDFAADKRAKYFSFDDCDTKLTSFSLGRANGDGQQASHWKDNLGIGLLDPTSARGESLAITAFDIQMFDAIGWNAVPEPGSIALFMLGAAGLAGVRRRRK